MKFLYFLLTIILMILTVEVAYCVYDDAVIGSWLCVTRITLCMLLLVSCVRRWTGVAKTAIWMMAASAIGCVYLCLLAKEDMLASVNQKTAESLVGKRTTFIAYMRKKTMDAWSTNFSLPYLNLLLVVLLACEIVLSAIAIITFAVGYKGHFHPRTAAIPMSVFVPTDSGKSPQIFYDNKKFPVYKHRESAPVIVEMEKYNEIENNQSSSSNIG